MPATPRILIVDDEPLILLFLTLTFQRAGYHVITAANGRDAVALCSAEPFDVLLSDVTMPGMDGHQLTQWVSVHCPGVRTALMSGFDAALAKYSSSPVCRFIAKPFRPREVVAFVDQVLAA